MKKGFVLSITTTYAYDHKNGIYLPHCEVENTWYETEDEALHALDEHAWALYEAHLNDTEGDRYVNKPQAGSGLYFRFRVGTKDEYHVLFSVSPLYEEDRVAK